VFSFFRKSTKVLVSPRMYLILREDLGFKYIQGGHCLASYALEHYEDFKKWNNSYLICLSVFNGIALQDLYEKMSNFDNFPFNFSVFFEPDLKSSLPTSLCIFEDGSGFVSDYLKDLSLATR